MGTARTVTLELLRHGPPHNQLLSPLTQYMALCGNHSATTVSVPFEQNQLVVRLNALRYRDSQETRDLQLKDTGQIMAEILGKVPGLIAELAEFPGQDGTSLTHLRLILSASELALLPFEIANAPNGFPGAGQPLALQAQSPVCVTREVRRVSNTRYKWPSCPRILFLAAAPPGVGQIPLAAHVLALRKAVEPWIDASDDREDIIGRLDRHLVVQTQASPGSIQRACATGLFTHVHVLAHGVILPGSEDKRYGLALHSDDDPNKADIVEGARFATLLRSFQTRGEDVLSGPAVVTLASCDSGDAGSVVGAGASVAHALQEGGIPLVVAAQFPLTFAASVVLAEVLYEGLLWGADPRKVLTDVRWQLKAKIQKTHDWASLVAYASLPADLRTQLSKIRFEQAHRSINAALKYMDSVTSRMKTKKSSSNTQGFAAQDTAARQESMNRARRKIADAKDRLWELKDSPQGAQYDKAFVLGLLASTEKRDAELHYRASIPDNWVGAATQVEDEERKMREALQRAEQYYADAFTADRSASWALVQQLSVSAVLSPQPSIRHDLWTVARVLSESELSLDDRTLVGWAHANLIELYLLSLLMQPGDDVPNPDVASARAQEHAADLVRVAVRNSSELYSTRRQITRYVSFFNEISSVFERLEPLANQILQIIPAIHAPVPSDSVSGTARFSDPR